MEDMRNSDDEEGGEEEMREGGGGGGGGGGLNWEEANSSTRYNLQLKRSASSLTDTPSERANMTWNQVVKEGYGWGIHHPSPNLHLDNRICLSFSDLSTIFPSVETVHHTSQQGLQGSLPSLPDNYLSPMSCYHKIDPATASVETLHLLNR